MTTVKTLARRGLTVCATIHSPTPYCFHLFDRLLLLLRGQVVYFGTGGAWGAGDWACMGAVHEASQGWIRGSTPPSARVCALGPGR